jgi:hypothetical protein
MMHKVKSVWSQNSHLSKFILPLGITSKAEIKDFEMDENYILHTTSKNQVLCFSLSILDLILILYSI